MIDTWNFELIRPSLGLTLAWQEPARFEGVTVREYLSLGKPEYDPEPALKRVGLDPDRYLNVGWTSRSAAVNATGSSSRPSYR